MDSFIEGLQCQFFESGSSGVFVKDGSPSPKIAGENAAALVFQYGRMFYVHLPVEANYRTG